MIPLGKHLEYNKLKNVFGGFCREESRWKKLPLVCPGKAVCWVQTALGHEGWLLRMACDNSWSVLPETTLQVIYSEIQIQ